jgi:hypothetical protein
MRGKSTKSLDCKICGEEVKNVGCDAEKVTCWKCVSKSLNGIVSLADEEEDENND